MTAHALGGLPPDIGRRTVPRCTRLTDSINACACSRNLAKSGEGAGCFTPGAAGNVLGGAAGADLTGIERRAARAALTPWLPQSSPTA